jgi:hypothetical protein
MPNWCSSTLIVSGPAAVITDLQAAVAGPDADFSLAAFLAPPEDPQPPTAAEAAELGLALYSIAQSDAALGWRMRYWGTKWEVAAESGVRVEDGDTASVRWELSSAWSAPVPAIGSLAQRFPEVQLQLRAGDGAVGYAELLAWRAGVRWVDLEARNDPQPEDVIVVEVTAGSSATFTAVRTPFYGADRTTGRVRGLSSDGLREVLLGALRDAARDSGPAAAVFIWAADADPRTQVGLTALHRELRGSVPAADTGFTVSATPEIVLAALVAAAADPTGQPGWLADDLRREQAGDWLLDLLDLPAAAAADAARAVLAGVLAAWCTGTWEQALTAADELGAEVGVSVVVQILHGPQDQTIDAAVAAVRGVLQPVPGRPSGCAGDSTRCPGTADRGLP